jgi:hypothetical protein
VEGAKEGKMEGDALFDGAPEGNCEGITDGDELVDGAPEGNCEGTTDGDELVDGLPVGVFEGAMEGAILTVGAVGSWLVEGAALAVGDEITTDPSSSSSNSSSAYSSISCRYPSTPEKGSVPLAAMLGKPAALTVAP